MESDGWRTKKKKGKGTLSDRLMDLAVDTGKHHILVMARQAKAGQLGEAGVAKARRLLGLGAKPKAWARGNGDLAKAATRRAEAAERKAKALEERLSKLETQCDATDDDVAMEASPTAPARRPAPEAAAAQAQSHAAALKESAERLRGAGLTEEADALDKKAAEHQKKAEGMPSLARRIELKESFVKRAEGRVLKGSTAVKDAKDKLDEAQENLKNVEAELAEAWAQLDQLRVELAKTRDPLCAPAADADSTVSAELAELRNQLAKATEEAEKLRGQNAVMMSAGRGLETELAAAKPELEAARAEKSAAERRHVELRALGSAELKRLLEQCFTDHKTALTAGRWHDAESLADSTRKLTAALREADEMEASYNSNFNPES